MFPLSVLLKEKVLIIGLGEVGHALFGLFKENEKFDVYGFDSDEQKMRNAAGYVELPEIIDVMHICYSYKEQEKFMQATLDYIKKV